MHAPTMLAPSSLTAIQNPAGSSHRTLQPRDLGSNQFQDINPQPTTLSCIPPAILSPMNHLFYPMFDFQSLPQMQHPYWAETKQLQVRTEGSRNPLTQANVLYTIAQGHPFPSGLHTPGPLTIPYQLPSCFVPQAPSTTGTAIADPASQAGRAVGGGNITLFSLPLRESGTLSLLQSQTDTLLPKDVFGPIRNGPFTSVASSGPVFSPYIYCTRSELPENIQTTSSQIMDEGIRARAEHDSSTPSVPFIDHPGIHTFIATSGIHHQANGYFSLQSGLDPHDQTMNLISSAGVESSMSFAKDSRHGLIHGRLLTSKELFLKPNKLNELSAKSAQSLCASTAMDSHGSLNVNHSLEKVLPVDDKYGRNCGMIFNAQQDEKLKEPPNALKYDSSPSPASTVSNAIPCSDISIHSSQSLSAYHLPLKFCHPSLKKLKRSSRIVHTETNEPGSVTTFYVMPPRKYIRRSSNPVDMPKTCACCKTTRYKYKEEVQESVCVS